MGPEKDEEDKISNKLHIFLFLYIKNNYHNQMGKGFAPLPIKVNRVKGRKYVFKGKNVIWSGKILFCEHKRQRSHCKECGGGSICEHKRLRSQCKECCPVELQYVRFCHVCGEHKVNRKYGTPGVCVQCDKTIPERIEHKVKNYLLTKLPPPSANDNQLTGTECGESKRRADLIWIGHDRVIQVEIDEDEHKSRTVDCELAKMDSSKWGLHPEDQCKPMVFVRFNPDGCQSEEEFEQRCLHLVSVVEQHLTMQMSNTLKTHVLYLYYSDTNKHLLAAKEKENFIVNNIKDI